MIKKALISIYLIVFVITYGHFYNNGGSNWKVIDRVYAGLVVSTLSPLYWSTIAFEVDDD